MYEKRLFGESHVLVYALCRGGGERLPRSKREKKCLRGKRCITSTHWENSLIQRIEIWGTELLN